MSTGAISNYLEDALLAHTLLHTTYTAPSTVYVALFSSATTDAGGGTELAGGSYARQAVSFGTPSGGVTSNTTMITFLSLPAVTVTHVAVTDASTGGHFLFHGPLDTPQPVAGGASLSFGVGQLACSLD